MSKKNAVEFVWRISKDENSMNRVSGFWSEDDIDAIVELGKQSGLDFSRDELFAAVRESSLNLPIKNDQN